MAGEGGRLDADEIEIMLRRKKDGPLQPFTLRTQSGALF